ncbi:brachyurin-like [Daphnia pulex]|uniref:brachyurin-like n=1 Tax=Daphnia pulex TaxID=6669 RepID=UPI001EE0040E|nr:brachyurin-like [Daphnia pulex]
MKLFLVAVLALAVLSQAAEIPMKRNLRPRSELFPRAPVAPGPGHIVVTEPAKPVDMRGFCGQAKVDSSRIVGGVEAVPHEFPWQVAVTIDGSSFCGGTLISDEWVMTAAHCADGANRFTLLLGAHDRTVAEPSQLTIETTAHATHPNWNPSTLANDVALIRLPEPITFTPEISPLCMSPATEPDHVGDTLLVSGWGKTADGAFQSISPVLMKVTAPAISTADCAATYGDIITDNILCIDTTGGHGSCNGDSGGPLSFDNNGVYNQVGIVSFGSSAGCTRGLPAGFTRVSSYAQWISLVTGLVI